MLRRPLRQWRLSNDNIFSGSDTFSGDSWVREGGGLGVQGGQVSHSVGRGVHGSRLLTLSRDTCRPLDPEAGMFSASKGRPTLSITF
jgi:hypothetical protein